MEQMVFWFNIMAFTLMFGSFGATYVLYGRTSPPWLHPYLYYLTSHAIFLLLITYRYFSLVYLAEPIPVLDSVVVSIRLVIDLLLLLIVPRFIQSLIPGKTTRLFRILILLAAALIFSVTIGALTLKHPGLVWISKILFNSYLGIITLSGLIRVRSSRVRSVPGVMNAFLYFSSAYYFVLLILTFVRIFVPPADTVIRSNIIIGGAGGFLWGAITLGYFIHKIFTREVSVGSPITSEFLVQFSITERERDIIASILQGMSNREIGEKLFISPRTVETHIYNIYRKCSVKNKLELANCISNTL